MRFKTEANDPENAGLKAARDFLAPHKKKYPEISYADLWVFAAYTYIENSGGPSIKFTPGRVDASTKEGPKKAIKPGRLPGAEHGLDSVRGARPSGSTKKAGSKAGRTSPSTSATCLVGWGSVTRRLWHCSAAATFTAGVIRRRPATPGHGSPR